MGSGDQENVATAALIATAREMIENFTGRTLLRTSWLLSSDTWTGEGYHAYNQNYLHPASGYEVLLDRSPLVSVEYVKYWPADGTAQVTLDSSAYNIIAATTPGRLQLIDAAPALAFRADAVQIAFTAGLATAELVPRTLRHAILLLVATLYENRQAAAEVKSIVDIPFGLQHLLQSQRIGGWNA